MKDLAAALREAGLRPRRVDMTPEQWHRCPTVDKPKSTNGRYILSHTRTGALFATILDMARPGWSMVWKPDAPVVIQPMDPAKLRKVREADRRKQLQASEGAREFYRKASPVIGGHDYLTQKGLGMLGCRGLKRDRDGWLVVPMLQEGKVISVQRIAPDGRKRFWPGAPTSGTRYTVDRQGATLTVLCEGLATGLAIFAAVPLSRVIVCFTAGNLPKVAAHLPRRGMAVVAADNDHQTAVKIGSNPGIEAANEAAALLGCGVAVPECEGSDWNDFRQEKLRQQASGPVYGKRAPSEAQLRRAVDAQIAREMMRAARLLSAAG